VSEHESQGYERSDADARRVVVSGFVLALLLVGSLAASAWIAQRFEEESRSGKPNPLADLRRVPQGPALQAVPARELEAHRAWEETMLEDTAWVDQVNKVVRIPVERALELSLDEGFPTRVGGAPK
jgi:hypothetical protein